MHNDPQTDVIEGRQDNDSSEVGGVEEECGEGSFCASEKTKRLFWQKVDVRGPDDCWEWKACRHKSGYGQMRLGKQRLAAHRFSLMLKTGRTFPRKSFVCHRCDNPPCCNPRHLFIGTQLDNMRDMWSKGRGPCGDRSGAKRHPEGIRRGELHGKAKLTTQMVVKMRSQFNSGCLSIPDIAKAFSLHPGSVWKIIHRKAWKHV